MTVRKGLFMGMAGVALISTQAMALDVQNGLNTLGGRAFGLDENYIGAPGDYVMPNGSTSSGAGTVGMTESLSNAGLNLPQPASVPGSDRRDGIINPLLGREAWGARTGAVIGWSEINFQNLLVAGPNPFNVTGVAYNFTPQSFIQTSEPALDNGAAPGSVAGDGIPDQVLFETDLSSGLRQVAVTLSFFGSDDTVAFGGNPVPAALIPRLNLYEGGNLAGFGPIPPGTALQESDFDHNFGDVTDTLAAFDDGTLLLTGQVLNATADLLWVETGVGTNQYVLRIDFEGTVVYDGGTLFDELDQSTAQTISANWENIPFPLNTNGLDFNGNDVFDFRGGANGIGGSFSSDQAFSVGDNVIPEPVTAGLGMMSLAALGSYVTRRRRA